MSEAALVRVKQIGGWKQYGDRWLSYSGDLQVGEIARR